MLKSKPILGELEFYHSDTQFVVKWNIRNFKDLEGMKENCYILSPSFTFANQEYCFSFFPNGYKFSKDAYCSIYLQREDHDNINTIFNKFNGFETRIEPIFFVENGTDTAEMTSTASLLESRNRRWGYKRFMTRRKILKYWKDVDFIVGVKIDDLKKITNEEFPSSLALKLYQNACNGYVTIKCKGDEVVKADSLVLILDRFFFKFPQFKYCSKEVVDGNDDIDSSEISLDLSKDIGPESFNLVLDGYT